MATRNTRSNKVDGIVPPIAASVTNAQTTRANPITCVIYGRDREERYPLFHFCSHCKNYEEQLYSKKKPWDGNRVTSKVYNCQAGHTSRDGPTVLKQHTMYCRNRNGVEIVQITNSIIDIQEPITVTDPIVVMQESTIVTENIAITKRNNNVVSEHIVINYDTVTESQNDMEDLLLDHNFLFQENNKLKSDIIIMKEEINTLKQMLSEFKQMKDKVRSATKSNHRLKDDNASMKHDIDNMTLVSLLPANISLQDFFVILEQLFQKVASQKNRNPSKMAGKVIDFFWSTEILCGCIGISMIEYAKSYFRKTYFSASRIMKLLDMHGGQLSYEGIEILRSLETNDEKYVTNTIIPSSSTIKRVCYNVDKYVSKIVPFTMGKLDDGSEFAEFQPEHVLPLLYKAYDLEKIAKIRPIHLNQSIDATQITTRQHVTVWGVKMIDVAAMDPKTGNLLYSNEDSCGIQSRNNCFPLKMALQRELNSVFVAFRPNMEQLRYYMENYIDDFMPIKCAMDCDLSATWKLLQMGGAYRNKTFACHLCAEKDDWVGQYYGVQCSKWCKRLHGDDPEFKCRHQTMLSDELVEDMKDNVIRLKEALKDLPNRMNQLHTFSCLNCQEDPRGVTSISQLTDIESIHFDITSSDVEEMVKDQYSQHITRDLALRLLNATGGLKVRQIRLKESLIKEWELIKLNESISHLDENKEKRLLRLIECVPCILHMENRCGLKILFMILTEGIKNAGDKITFKSSGTKKQRIAAFISKVEEIGNTQVLGNDNHPAHWHVPHDSTKVKITSITLDNNRTRSLINNLDLLINICVDSDNHDRKRKYSTCMTYYKNLFVMVRKKDDFTDEEIDEFQLNADFFYSTWIELVGKEGITNYIHMIGSGHISEFLQYYRNLYTHSQQGWEHFNSFLKVYFFRRTMRGGGKYGDGSKIKPIARWLGRRLIWMSRTTYQEMKDYLDNNKTEDMEEEEEIDDFHIDIGIDNITHDLII